MLYLRQYDRDARRGAPVPGAHVGYVDVRGCQTVQRHFSESVSTGFRDEADLGAHHRQVVRENCR